VINTGAAFDYAPDQRNAAEWFMQCAQSRSQLFQQNVQSTQQNLWRQGQSDKPMRPEFAAVGA